MSEKPRPTVSPLAQVEMETLEQGREWMRRRLQAKLQRLADRQGAIPPPSATAAQARERSDAHDLDLDRQGRDRTPLMDKTA